MNFKDRELELYACCSLEEKRTILKTLVSAHNNIVENNLLTAKTDIRNAMSLWSVFHTNDKKQYKSTYSYLLLEAGEVGKAKNELFEVVLMLIDNFRPSDYRGGK